MPSKKRLSRQDIIRAQQRSTFVGRVEQLEAFEDNLSHLEKAEDGTAYPKAFLFNIWGQGGVGKTTLLKRFEDIAKRYGAVVALTDEAIDAVPEVMAEFARQLRAQGKPCERFDERYRVYRQKRKELETDPEAPQGFSAFMGKTVAKVGLSLGRQVPGAGAAIDFVDEKAVVDSAGEWAAYVTRKLKNKDEVQLVNEPVEVLTPLFLEDLGEIAGCQVVLLFDTFERTDEVLEQWLLDVVADRYGELPINCIWSIAGREQLNPNRWSGYSPVPLRVEPFTTAEATYFLQRKGITNDEVIEKILDLSERLPLMLAILAESASNNPADLAEASGTAVERFLKWVDDSEKRALAIEAALPQSLNKDVIALLVGEEKSEALFGWLKAMPFVRERSDGWAYHDVVRPQMLRYQKKASENEWAQKHLQLANYYGNRCQQLGLKEDEQYKDGDWQGYALEQLYHRLCSHPQQELPSALSQFVQALKQKRTFAQQWVAVMGRAGSDADNSDVESWGRRLFNGLQAYDDDQYAQTINAFTQLLRVETLEAHEKAIVLAWRGEVYRLDSDYESALADFDSTIEIDGEYAWAIAHRGETYRLMKRYEEALTDFNRAIELDPKYKWAITNRGVTYQSMKRYEEALADFNSAVELDPEYKWAITNRGVTYQSMKRYEEALADLNRAIELDPEYKWAIANTGKIHQLTKRYEEALTDFNRVIELAPEYTEVIANRGETYRLMKRYEEALTDFNRAIELDPEYKWAIANRGETYRLM
ncbi:MAG: tetratricopeptide repeat protein, partial [Cyanobacteria bacterium J06631_12]